MDLWFALEGPVLLLALLAIFIAPCSSLCLLTKCKRTCQSCHHLHLILNSSCHIPKLSFSFHALSSPMFSPFHLKFPVFSGTAWNLWHCPHHNPRQHGNVRSHIDQQAISQTGFFFSIIKRNTRVFSESSLRPRTGGPKCTLSVEPDYGRERLREAL